MIYLSTAVGLTPGGSSTVHIYTQTVHRTTQRTTNWEQCRPCPFFASFPLAFASQLRKKHGKPQSGSPKTKTPTHYKTHTNTHTHAPKHYKTYTHTHTHTRAHSLQNPHKHTHTHIHTRPHIEKYTQIHTHSTN